MTSIHHRLQILDSLNNMDQAQMEKVLSYIKGLMRYRNPDKGYQRFKNEALKEIREALKEKKI